MITLLGNLVELYVGFESDCSMNGVLQRLLDILGKYAEVVSVHGGYWGERDGFVRFGLKNMKADRALVADRLNALVQVAHAEFEDANHNRHHYGRACYHRSAAA